MTNEWAGDNHQKRKEQSFVCEECKGLFVTKHPVKSKDGLWRCEKCNNNKRSRECHRYKTCRITSEQYEELFKKQNGVCAICQQPEWRLNSKKNGLRSLCVDHDHDTGKVRGLLCGSCNSSIGWLKEDTRLLLEARNYLIKHKERQSWDEYFLEMAIIVASRSRDPSTKVGAIIVRPNNTVAGQGYNGFSQKMEDIQELLDNREEKYSRVIHAEMNALIFAKEPLSGYTLYSSLLPCDRCFVVMAQSGIVRFVSPKPTVEQISRWGQAFDKTRQYASEMKLTLVEY